MSMASSWMDSPTDKAGQLLKHQIKAAVSGVSVTIPIS